MEKVEAEDCSKAKSPRFYWNTGFMDSMLTGDNLLRERLNMIWDDDSLNPYRLSTLIRRHDFIKVKEYCDKYHKELKDLEYDEYHPVHIACECNDINVLSYLLELHIFDDWQVNDMYKSLEKLFMKENDKLTEDQDTMINMIKYYANTVTKRARST
tara:strand:+ start:4108 stop:4575 length:468 start_codon:yes stop_codon:yes gene_type:complete